MLATEWFDRVKIECEIPSDYALANALKVSKQYVSKTRSQGTKTVGAALCIRIANLLGLDPMEVIEDQVKERARCKEREAGFVAPGALPLLAGAAEILREVYILCSIEKILDRGMSSCYS